MFVPNPVAVGVLKLVGYWGVGILVKRRAAFERSPLTFGALRVALGLIIGAIFAVLAMKMLVATPEPRWSPLQVYALLTIPRYLAWALLIHVWFRPVHGGKSTFAWAAMGTAVSAAIDVLVLFTFEDVALLRSTFTWC